MADTLQQLWQQQFDALNRSKAVYDKTIQALEILAAPTAARLTVLKNAQRGLLDTEYQMRLFLRTDTRLLDDAARIGQRLANDNSPTAFQRDQLQRQQAQLISEAGDFATLRSEVGWGEPGIQTIPIGNKIYDNLGTPPMWDWNSSGGRFGEALENFLGNLQSAGPCPARARTRSISPTGCSATSKARQGNRSFIQSRAERMSGHPAQGELQATHPRIGYWWVVVAGSRSVAGYDHDRTPG